MNKKNKNIFSNIWLEEIWEEIEVQFYGITVALIFFISIYLLFKPLWMNPAINFILKKINLFSF